MPDATALVGIITKQFQSAKKDQSGSISRKESIKILQNVFKSNNGTYSYSDGISRVKDQFSATYAYAAGFGFGYGGFLSQTKDLFELYTDVDSDGGAKITPKEQQSIIETVKSWFKGVKTGRREKL